ncbi:MAG TPA: hypothetical protein VH540_25300 [Ktedonobacterales bacterium]|jgi:hypothetical protein
MKKRANNLLLVGALLMALLGALALGPRLASAGHQISSPHRLLACSPPMPPCY